MKKKQYSTLVEEHKALDGHSVEPVSPTTTKRQVPGRALKYDHITSNNSYNIGPEKLFYPNNFVKENAFPT